MKENSAQQYDDEIDLRELFHTLWKGRWIIAITSLASVGLAIIISVMLPNEYKATTLLAPQNSSSSIGPLASQFGGLASIAGISLGSGENDESQIAIEVMQSWSFVEKFIKEETIEVEIFSVTRWDSERGLIVDDDLYSVEEGKWVKQPPSSWELFEEFSHRLNVSQAKDTGLISVSFEYFSPFLAKEWLDKYIDSINEHMRSRKLEQVNSNIEYLQNQVKQTSITEMKEVFYKIIEEQVKNKMLAEASPEYAFAIVNKTMVPEEVEKPNRVLIVVLSFILGALVGVFWVLIVQFIYTN